MRKCYFVIFIVGTFLLRAQGFKVRHYIANALTNSSKAIFETSPGNYIAAGIALDTINGEQVNHLTIMGLGANGELLWHKKYGGNKWMYLDNSFITRSFYKQGNFLYHACCVQDSNGKYNGVLLKFNFNGDTLWQKIYRDSLGLIPQMVTGSVDGGFLITGYFFSGNPGLLIKTDANGNELWRKKFGPVVQDGKAIIQDSTSKKIVVLGYQQGSGNSISDNVLILDSLGNFVGQPNFNSYGGWPVDLIQTKDKNIVYVGRAIYPQTVGGNNLAKAFAIKFDLNNLNTPLWKVDNFEGLELTNYFNCIRELDNEDLLILGVYDTMQLNNMYLNYYTRITKLDKNGVLKSNRHYDYKTNSSTSHFGQAPVSLELTSDGGYIIAIRLTNVPAPNPFFFVKYDSMGCDSSAAHCATLNLVGVKEVQSKDVQVGVYPNPVKDFLNIEIQKNGDAENIEITLVTVQGHEVKKLNINHNEKIDLSDLKNGLYLLVLKQEGEVIYTTKIVKE